MGGKTFQHPRPGEPALNTPRMLPSTYRYLRDCMIENLKEHFEEVNVAAEAPGKADFGDIDFQVWGPTAKIEATIDGDKVNLCEMLKRKLNATRSIYHPTVDTMGFAIPMPEGLETREDVKLPPDVPFDNTRHFQIDIVVCLTHDDYEMQRALHSHGDWRDILAVALRPVGLVFIPAGFALRVQQMQESGLPSAEQRCRVVLSKNPDDICRFLGMDRKPLRKGFEFATLNDVFDWMASSRFFSRDPYEDTVARDAIANHANGTDSFQILATASNEITKLQRPSTPTYTKQYRDKVLKKRRPMFEQFLHDWLPRHPQAGKTPAQSREDVLQEAVRFFRAEQSYGEVLANFRKEDKERTFWEDVTKVITDDMISIIPDDYVPPAHSGSQPVNVSKIRLDKINRALRALRRFVRFEAVAHQQFLKEEMPTSTYYTSKFASLLLSSASHHYLPVVITDKENDVSLPTHQQLAWTQASDLTSAELLTWTKENWAKVAELERRKAHENTKRKMELKAAKRAAKAEAKKEYEDDDKSEGKV